MSTLGLWLPASVFPQSPPAAPAPEVQAGSATAERLGMNKRAVSGSLEAVQSGITPTDQFYVRSHFAEPRIPMADWRLRIEGKVTNPAEFTFADLLAAPIQKQEALLECAGNLQLLVSNGVWEGVPMSYLLKQAGPTAGAQQVLLEGADAGSLMPDLPLFPFTSVIPFSKALAPETLVAFRLNGQFLPPRNGFPARALVAGWYGMDSVKWLRRIVVLGPGERPDAYYKSGRYMFYARLLNDGGHQRLADPVTDLLVRSNIVYPMPGANLAAGKYTIWGFAWAGQSTIDRVDVSVDTGKSWARAEMEAVPRPLTWVKWKYDWEAARGNGAIMSRATDSAGNTQPLVRDPRRLDSWETNWCRPVLCSVK
jgi:DMSO/TMAO reductase YedYZ molybdopterin-dependent catalytic subunit